MVTRSLMIGVLLATGISVTAFHYLKKAGKEKKIEAFFEGEEEEEEEEKEGHQTGADKQLQGWFWSKGYPAPENLGQKYEQAWQEYLAVKENTQKLLPPNNDARITGFGGWLSLGNVAGIGGRVVCITIDPNAPNNNLFIGTASGGIYKSTNGGGSWSYVNTGLPVLGVGAITYHPANSNVLLAGTGEVYRVNGSDQGNVGFNVWKCRGTYGIGIIRSTDGGATWAKVLNKQSAELFAVQEIVYNPGNANEVFACATDGLYKSTDGGATWSTTPFFAKTYVRDIAINPANTQQMVITVGNLANSDKGIYRTTNGGANWTKCAGLPTAYTGYVKVDNNGSRLYASFGIGGTNNELYMSGDFGGTWYAKTSSSHCGGQYWFGHDVAVDPNDADKVIMGGVNYYTYASLNPTTGGTRTAVAASMHADVHDIRFHPTNSNIVYAANDGGMYKSTDGGSTFSAINNGLVAVQFYASFATSPTNSNVMIGGLQDNGVVKYDGTGWASILGGDGGPAVFHPKNGNKVLYSNDARAVFYSSNAGASETQVMPNLGYGYAAAHDDRTGFMSPVGMSYPTAAPNNLVMYAASDNLHVSLDSGGGFSNSDPVSQMSRPIDLQYKPAIALAVSKADRNKVYVSTSPLSQRADDGLNVNVPARVLVSNNASNATGYAFTNISGHLPDRFTTDFAISKFDDDSIYITMGGFGTGHVYLSPDGGTTWINRSSGLPDVPFNAVLIDPVRPDVIYAACDFGVYVSPNRGVNWYDFNNGFWENTLVMDLQATADNKLVAATHGKGAFRTDLFVPPASLPVNFLAFYGVHHLSENSLHWRVGEEKDLKEYALERSDDGVHYGHTASIKAKNGIPANAYSYSDKKVTGNSDFFYYRLKTIDGNGTYFYSDVVRLRNEGPHNALLVLGNPFTDKINFQYESAAPGKLTFRLADANGKLLRNEEKAAAQGLNRYALENLADLSQGFYVLHVQSGKTHFSEKLIKR